MSTALPGFDSPAVGFEQPFEMLEACHDRVRRSLALLGRLLAHVDSHGHDPRSRDAARDVLRYFDLAAPAHHDDEERHVFPALRARGDPALAALVDRLQGDHVQMSRSWSALRPVLQSWADDPRPAAPDAATRGRAQDFIALYGGHLEVEEGRVFPAARAGLDAAAIARMGQEMQSRRRGENAAHVDTPPASARSARS